MEEAVSAERVQVDSRRGVVADRHQQKNAVILPAQCEARLALRLPLREQLGEEDQRFEEVPAVEERVEENPGDGDAGKV